MAIKPLSFYFCLLMTNYGSPEYLLERDMNSFCVHSVAPLNTPPYQRSPPPPPNCLITVPLSAVVVLCVSV